MKYKHFPGSRSSSPQSGPSTYSDNTELRAEVIHLRNRKQQLDEECHLLRHENEMLVQELQEIQTGKPFYQNGGIGIPVSVNITLHRVIHKVPPGFPNSTAQQPRQTRQKRAYQ